MSPHRLLFFYVVLALFVQLGCSGGSIPSASNHNIPSPMPASPTPPQIAPKPTPQLYPELELFDEMAKEEKNATPIDYKGFHVIRKMKKVLLGETTKPTELSYAQILRDRKVIMTFDGVAHPLGNETRFGLFPFLSSDSQQLLVQQDGHRDSRQWIVSLETQPKVLMNSSAYQLENFRAMDLDRNGQFELVGMQRYWHFEFMKGMTFSSADSPDITIVFAYDQKTQKYEPANPRFKAYLLESTEEIKSRFAGTDGKAREGYLLMQRMSDVMQGTMTLALAGEENPAWEFFDRYCPAEKPEEKADAKSRIKLAIRENTIYKVLKRTHQL